MDLVDFLIFSKNRPMQLESLLDSFFHFVDRSLVNKVSILYKSDSEYENSYELLKVKFSDVVWCQEENFHSQVLDISSNSGEWICFLVDDIIFYQPVKGRIFPKIDEICFSLRLGENCIYCHPANSYYNKPAFNTDSEFINWSWFGCQFDFGYPMSLDGHIFHGKILKEMLKYLKFRNPNSLENALVYQNTLLSSLQKTRMRSFKTSRLVGIPINRVNDEVLNRSGIEFPFSESELLHKFERGESIDWTSMDFTKIIGPHQELILNFKTSDNYAIRPS